MTKTIYVPCPAFDDKYCGKILVGSVDSNDPQEIAMAKKAAACKVLRDHELGKHSTPTTGTYQVMSSNAGSS